MNGSFDPRARKTPHPATRDKQGRADSYVRADDWRILSSQILQTGEARHQLEDILGFYFCMLKVRKHTYFSTGSLHNCPTLPQKIRQRICPRLASA